MSYHLERDWGSPFSIRPLASFGLPRHESVNSSTISTWLTSLRAGSRWSISEREFERRGREETRLTFLAPPRQIPSRWIPLLFACSQAIDWQSFDLWFLPKGRFKVLSVSFGFHDPPLLTFKRNIKWLLVRLQNDFEFKTNLFLFWPWWTYGKTGLMLSIELQVREGRVLLFPNL